MAQNELVFVALGGLGEIGRNAALYGFGPKGKRKWLMVDCGLSFAGPDLPGIDLVMPDIAFVEKVRKDLVGLIITHAHEDHIGALADLWPRLKCPVYASPFAIGLAETKRLMEPGAPTVPFREIRAGQRIDIAPFDVEFINVAHSIPESLALAIRTEAGTLVHSGDWKIDTQPMIGAPTDEARLRQIGEEGVLALVSDSTNVLRDGVSPSETDVAASLAQLIADAPQRVVVTTFASNVARIRAVAEAALKSGRQVVVLGRAMDRTIAVARECGYLPGIPPFLSSDVFDRLPRKQVVALATGSQGEDRAALARIARDDHPDVRLARGDRVIFSSRTIPGNEREVGAVINGLVDQGIEVITDRTHMVHVSGHPRRGEMVQLYNWLKPQIAVPAHGEPLHLSEHMAFARAQGVRHVMRARNGDLLALWPEDPGVVESVAHGRLLKDGNVLISESDDAVRQRVRLSFAGVVSVAVGLGRKGEMIGDPDIVFSGLPARVRSPFDGKIVGMDEVIDRAVFETLDNLPANRRRDPETVSNALERAIRGAVNSIWGKKPLVHVMIVEA